MITGNLATMRRTKILRKIAATMILLSLAVGRTASGATLDTVILGNTSSESSHGLVATNSDVYQNELTVFGPGDIWNSADCLFFYNKALQGDGWIQARVTSTGDTNDWTKAGVMMRETLNANSRNAFMFDSWNQGVHSQWRGSTGGGTSQGSYTGTGTAPYWVRVERAGNVFTMKASSDGTSWTTVTTLTLNMASGIYMGLVTSASATDKINYSTFDNITSSLGSTDFTGSTIGATNLVGGTSLAGFGETARRLLPKNPIDYYGGDLVFNMAVDPVKQNYCSIKLWGSEGGYKMGRLVLNIGDGNGNWYEIGSRHGVGLEMFVDGVSNVSPGAFWFKTTLLPKWYTQGKTSVPIRLRSTGSFNAYGTIWNYDTYQGKLAQATRGLYRVYTHDDPVFTPTGETLGTPLTYSGALTRSNSDDAAALAALKTDINSGLTANLAKTAPGGNEINDLAKAYKVAWTNAYQSATALNWIVAGLDQACRDYYSGTIVAGASWGGAFGSHGEALTRIASLIQSQLDTQINLGGGTGLSRRTQYAAMLKASRDFGRIHRKTITNQAMACDFNVYKANAGLLAINSSDAFTETAARRYVYEAVGLQEYGGSDISVADPGPSWSMGRGFYMVTSRGTTHEGSWTTYDDYGRMAPYVFGLYRFNGDIVLRDRAVQMEKSHHVNMLYPSLDEGNYRSMLNEGAISCRNVYLPGRTSYVDPGIAATKLDPVLLGAAIQALADGQFFRTWRESSQDVYLPDDYAQLTSAVDPGNRPPTLSGQPNWAWADEQNALLSIRYNNEQHFITFLRKANGLNHFGDGHSLTSQYQRVVQFWVDDVRYVDSGLAHIMGPEVESTTDGTPPDAPVSAWNGQKWPYALDEYGKTVSLADFYGARYGDFLIGMNCSFGKTFQYAPEGFTSGLDLISGKTMTGPVSVPPQTTVIFYSPVGGASAPEQSLNPIPVNSAAGIASSSVTLSWEAGARAARHRVYFGPNPTPGSSEYKGEQSSLTYSTGGLAANTTYYWRVDEVNTIGVKTGVIWKFTTASAYSTLTSQDIGAVGVAGSYSVSNGVHTLAGSGSDIYNSPDSFRYASVPVAGDCSIVARITSQTKGKSGVMIRESLSSDARFIDMVLQKNNYSKFEYRNTAGGGGGGQGGPGYMLPYWVKLTRVGNVLTGSVSPDGSVWTQVNQVTLLLPNSVNIGLVECALDNTTLQTATFDNVVVMGGVAVPATPAGLSATRGNQQAGLKWTAVSGATGYNLKRSTNIGGPWITVVENVAGTSAVNTGLVNNTIYYYVVSALSTGGESPNSSLASVTPINPPLAPASVSAVPFDGEVDLTWSASTSAAGYNVKRSLKSDGYYTTIASNVTNLLFTDLGLKNGTTYFYVVTATIPGGESGNSVPAYATPWADGGSDAWGSTDVGSVAIAGSAGYNNGTYTVTGSGRDIWDAADGFQFVSQPLTGDGTIIARVISQTGGKTGVMMRETLAANSRFADMFLHKNNGAKFECRTATGGSASNPGRAPVNAPYWMKLSRVGNVFTGYVSADGVTWTQTAQVTNTMNSTIYVGLIESATSGTGSATGVFDSVNLVPGSAWSAQDIGSPAIAGFTSFSGGVLTLNAGGSDIWGIADQFRYTYQAASGDCDMTARITGVQNTDLWAKAGVMIRETLAAGSAHASVDVTPGNGTVFQWRDSTGATSVTTGSNNLTAPCWVRITRVGNAFTAYRSVDGTNWTVLGSRTIVMGTRVYIGIAATAHNASNLSTAMFSDLKANP